MIEFNTNLKRKILVYQHAKSYVVEIRTWNDESGEHSDQVHVQKGTGVIICRDVPTYSVYQESEENPFIIAEHDVTGKFRVKDFNGIVMIERLNGK